MAAPTDFKSLQGPIAAALVSTTRSAAEIAAEDISFYRSLDPSVGTALDRQNGRLLRLAERLIATAAAGSDVVGPTLPDVDSIDNNWKGIVDVFDSLLEKADTSLDEYTGVVKRLSPGQEQIPAPKPRPNRAANFMRSKDLPKPQFAFDHRPSNNEKEPFKPFLKTKPHATISLEKSLHVVQGDNGTSQFKHPYETEIDRYSFPTSMYTKAAPIPYTPLEQSSAAFVDTLEGVATMLDELKAAEEIAIDLEHHDSRSYTGIVCLMQISTRNKDWIVDTLKPWRRKLQCLNEVFADPKILKVLHGARMDIIWLQRDLGLYVVGMFDTYYAARALGYTGGSLAFLLQKFVNFTAQKQYQMADWRTRPLPTEMFDYARSDTHFLLYIYDNVRNELIDKSDFSDPDGDRIKTVLDKSKETALQRYEQYTYDEVRGMGASGWYRLLSKTPALFSKEQFSVFRAVHQWRDTVAREEDESVNYVMPNHVLFTIARAMPADKAALFSIAHPISHPLRARAEELVAAISKAKAAGVDGPEMGDVFGSTETPQTRSVPQPTTFTPPSSTSLGTSSLLPLRTSNSNFWGRAFGINTNRQVHSSVPASLRLAIPLPRLTASIFANPSEANGPAPTAPAELPEHLFMKEKDRQKHFDPTTEIFTIKEMKRKRAGDNAASILTPQGQVAEPEEGDEATSATAPEASDEKKRLRRERKLARRLEREKAALEESNAPQEAVSVNAAADASPFDYANAPSVLHGQRDAHNAKGPKGDKGGFNAYARAMDTKGGLKRTQFERPGKSATFKN